MIVRPTAAGGVLTLTDEPALTECALCRAERPIGLIVTTPTHVEPVTLDTAICATCLSTGLALLFGREHVLDGGRLEDLTWSAPVDQTHPFEG